MQQAPRRKREGAGNEQAADIKADHVGAVFLDVVAARGQPGFPASLVAVTTAAHELSALCPEEPALAFASFASSVASAGLQHRLTEAAEAVRLKDGLAQAQLSVVDKAHFNSCSGVWFRAGCASSSRAASRSS